MKFVHFEKEKTLILLCILAFTKILRFPLLFLLNLEFQKDGQHHLHHKYYL